ncbi:hypothetical protein GCM10020219_049730 [Nonomuraea dietziae]
MFFSIDFGAGWDTGFGSGGCQDVVAEPEILGVRREVGLVAHVAGALSARVVAQEGGRDTERDLPAW